MIITSEVEPYLLLISDFSRRKRRKSKHNSTSLLMFFSPSEAMPEKEHSCPTLN